MAPRCPPAPAAVLRGGGGRRPRRPPSTAPTPGPPKLYRNMKEWERSLALRVRQTCRICAQRGGGGERDEICCGAGGHQAAAARRDGSTGGRPCGTRAAAVPEDKQGHLREHHVCEDDSWRGRRSGRGGSIGVWVGPSTARRAAAGGVDPCAAEELRAAGGHAPRTSAYAEGLHRAIWEPRHGRCPPSWLPSQLQVQGCPPSCSARSAEQHWRRPQVSVHSARRASCACLCGPPHAVPHAVRRRGGKHRRPAQGLLVQ